MARQPKQVHVFLFRKKNGRYEYAIFQRADMLSCWQGVCGGLEDNESLEEGARRELFEEAGVKDNFPLYQLESISYLPATIFGAEREGIWGKNIVVVPMFFFAMPFDKQITLSQEHQQMKWLPYEDAYNLVYFLDQKTALYELNERLLRNNLYE